MSAEEVKSEYFQKSLQQFSPEDRKSLVDVFLWLIQEDKKQNPEFYKSKIKI